MRRLLSYLLLLALISALIGSSICYGASIEDSIKNVYSRLAEAEKAGADVHDAALKLEKALERARQARENPENGSLLLAEAEKLVNEVNSSIPLLIETGQKRIFWRNVEIASAASLIAVSVFFTYYYGPRIFWGTWLRIRSRWIVEVSGRSGREAGKRDRR